MGRKKGSTNKSKPKVTRTTQKQTQKQIVHVHIEKTTKTTKKRSSNKPKEQLPIPLSKNALKPGTNYSTSITVFGATAYVKLIG